MIADEDYYNVCLVTPTENALSIDGDRIKAKNATEANAVLVVASYDENNNLIDVKLINFVPKSIMRKTITETGVNMQNANNVKVMLWENMQTIKSLVPFVTMP